MGQDLLAQLVLSSKLKHKEVLLTWSLPPAEAQQGFLEQLVLVTPPPGLKPKLPVGYWLYVSQHGIFLQQHLAPTFPSLPHPSWKGWEMGPKQEGFTTAATDLPLFFVAQLCLD